MNETVIQVRDISKQYRLGVIGTGTLTHDLQRFWARIRGKEDPFLRVGQENNREAVTEGEYVWALKDINFEVKKGEVLGIIGKNGAGKSTLLKILSQLTHPTTGEVKIKGRVASLLEVGTGFHPDLTGRENIYLNGAILGMTKAEITRKFDEIVEFSGVKKYIETPVKRYSSGMKVRLGFAVAAYLDPEILIVDEVLAVGDAEFQAKCVGKMQDVAASGRTVLFVSHNLSAVRNLCQKGVVLKNGKVSFIGPIEEAINHYRSDVLAKKNTDTSHSFFQQNIQAPFQLRYAALINEGEEVSTKFEYTAMIRVRVQVEIYEKRPDSMLGILLEDTNGNSIIVSTSDESGTNILADKSAGKYVIDLRLPQRLLKPGIYGISLTARGKMDKPYHREENCLSFEVVDTTSYRSMKNLYRKQAVVAPELLWEERSIEIKSINDLKMQLPIFAIGDSHTRAFAHNTNFFPLFVGAGKENNFVSEENFLNLKKRIVQTIEKLKSSNPVMLVLGEPDARFYIGQGWYPWDSSELADITDFKKNVQVSVGRYTQLIRELKEKFPNPILIFNVTPSKRKEQNIVADFFNAQMKQVASQEKLVFIDINGELYSNNEEIIHEMYYGDTVHMNNKIQPLVENRLLKEGFIQQSGYNSEMDWSHEEILKQFTFDEKFGCYKQIGS